MRCREFHGKLGAWTRDELVGEAADRMSEHAAGCRFCAEEAEMDRSLRASFRTVAPIQRTPDLWERIESRVATTRRPRFQFQMQKMFAMSGALAAGVLLCMFALPSRQGHIVVDPITVVERPQEPGVLDKINTIRMTDTDPSATYAETQNSGDAAHLLLVGGPGR